jgi:hypothetical protein
LTTRCLLGPGSNLAVVVFAILAESPADDTACDLLDQWAQDNLNDPWRSGLEGFFKGISGAVVNSAFGACMGPLGGTLMTIAAPVMLVTQVYFNAIGIYDAYQRYRDTNSGDSRLLWVRSTCATVNLALTLIQFRLNLRRG